MLRRWGCLGGWAARKEKIGQGMKVLESSDNLGEAPIENKLSENL